MVMPAFWKHLILLPYTVRKMMMVAVVVLILVRFPNPLAFGSKWVASQAGTLSR